MDEDDRLVFRQNDVGLSRQLPVVEPEPVTGSVEKRAYDHLGLRILALDAAHVP